MVFEAAGRKARGHHFLVLPLLPPLVPAALLARFCFPLPPLPQNSREFVQKPRFPQLPSSHCFTQHQPTALRLTEVQVPTTASCQSLHLTAIHIHHFQAQPEHAGSPQRGGVLPPTPAARRLPPRVPAGPESAKRFTHTT
jgi:hypothetical protein